VTNLLEQIEGLSVSEQRSLIAQWFRRFAEKNSPADVQEVLFESNVLPKRQFISLEEFQEKVCQAIEERATELFPDTVFQESKPSPAAR
jgi:hypothetical protein